MFMIWMCLDEEPVAPIRHSQDCSSGEDRAVKDIGETFGPTLDERASTCLHACVGVLQRDLNSGGSRNQHGKDAGIILCTSLP